MYETNKGDYIMALEGVYTKEFVYDEFKKLETNAEKVKYLKDLKQLNMLERLRKHKSKTLISASLVNLILNESERINTYQHSKP